MNQLIELTRDVYHPMAAVLESTAKDVTGNRTFHLDGRVLEITSYRFGEEKPAIHIFTFRDADMEHGLIDHGYMSSDLRLVNQKFLDYCDDMLVEFVY